MKKIIKYVLLFALISGLSLIMGGVIFSIGHGRVPSVELKTYPKELIVLQEFVKKEFNLPNDYIIYDLREKKCDDMKSKESYKYDYSIYIYQIKTPKYLKDTTALDKKIDSIGLLITKYLPQKECHDSICINYGLYDPINKIYFHNKEKKYKVN